MKLTANVKQEILEHAKQSPTQEVCGIVYVVKGRQKYYAAKNLAVTPSEHFILDAADYVAVEGLGAIIAIVHSHPRTAPSPSQADQLSCNRCGIPYVIINPNTEQWCTVFPNDYQLPYVGREFVFGVVDCYTLLQDWYSREFGLKLSDFTRRDNFWERGENLYLDNYLSQGFKQVPMDAMQYGDGILMQLNSTLPNHGAVYIGDQMILHHLQGRLSSRDIYGGYWQKNTAVVVRHESR